jgi:DNA-binding MarR family transcriptional regulator/ribosomal protein S18 acetylase RimI-like enzyme
MNNESPEELIRDFNRSYTSRFDLLSPTYLGSSYSLTEARLLFELANLQRLKPSQMAETLGIDKGYVSRILNRFVSRKLISIKTDKADKRSRTIALTSQGREQFKSLQRLANDQAKAFLESIPKRSRRQVLDSYREIQSHIAPNKPPPQSACLVIRTHRCGDLGTILKCHGEFYAHELGWGIQFEGYVAETLAEFARKYEANDERIWIAERDGSFVGCVGLVKVTTKTAQLRWLLVLPETRGLGLGMKLTSEVLSFAKSRNYREVILWTEESREGAKAVYTKLGFRVIGRKTSKTFGVSVIEEKWKIKI